MSKAIIVELNKHHAIVLAEGGSFIKVKRKSDYWAVGQEIDAASLVSPKRHTFTLFSWKTAFAGVAAALLLFFQFFYPFTGEEVYASVSMDMEPSIELEINKDLLVINMTAYNAQGEDVLHVLKNWEGKPISYVTKKIFEISSASGFVKPHQEVLITTTITEDISDTEERKLKSHVNHLMQQEAKKQNLEMTSIVLSKKEKMKAVKYGISPGQYAIMQAAKKRGQAMKAKDVQDQSLEKLSKKVGPVKELFSEDTAPAQEKEKTGFNKGTDSIQQRSVPSPAPAPSDEHKHESEKRMATVPSDKPKPNERKNKVPCSEKSTIDKTEPKKSEPHPDALSTSNETEQKEENIPLPPKEAVSLSIDIKKETASTAIADENDYSSAETELDQSRVSADITVIISQDVTVIALNADAAAAEADLIYNKAS